MIFWVLLGLAAVAILWTYIVAGEWEGWGTAFLPALGAALISGTVGALAIFISLNLISGEKVTPATFDLRAISTSADVEGRFFLGFGYINGQRILNYIAQEGDFSRLGQASASAAHIWEDSDRSTVTEYTWWYSNGWVVPWEFKTGHSWDFHVPAGSILGDYTITN